MSIYRGPITDLPLRDKYLSRTGNYLYPGDYAKSRLQDYLLPVLRWWSPVGSE